ncbi:MAG: glycoside hydrolase family 5 protein, partial [Christensenellales bacterium]
MKKKVLRIAFCCVIVTLLIMTSTHSAAAVINKIETIRLPFRDLSAAQITKEMGIGWNLGNTMDGHSAFMPSETAWQSVATTSGLIDAVHDFGFNTVRIPVTWGLKIDDENNYAIDTMWLNRVREVADYCLAQDMYVIINIHHDGAEQTGWLRVAAKDGEFVTVKEKFARVWEQIALAFSGYDEHVIFESMNEVKSDDDTREGILRDFQAINELNRIFVDTVRKTGGNNTRRWLLVPGRYTNIVNTTNKENGFALPEDPWNDENRLMVSVHDYDYSFGLLETMGITSWSEDSALKMAGNFQKLIDNFTSGGIPVVLGEYGAVNKNNTEARAYYYEVMARLSRLSGVVCCVWDNGWYDMTRDPDY